MLLLLKAYLDWVSPDLTRNFRMWNLLLPQKSDQLMIESFSQRSFTIIKSPMATSVVMRNDRVVLPFRTGLQGESRSNVQRSASQIEKSPPRKTVKVCECVSAYRCMIFYCLMYVHNKGNVLLLCVGSIQRNLQWLLGKAQRILTEEMHLHLVMENWDGRKTGGLPRVSFTVQFSFFLCLHVTVTNDSKF